MTRDPLLALLNETPPLHASRALLHIVRRCSPWGRFPAGHQRRLARRTVDGIARRLGRLAEQRVDDEVQELVDLFLRAEALELSGRAYDSTCPDLPDERWCKQFMERVEHLETALERAEKQSDR